MERQLEIDLIQELLGLREKQSHYLDDTVAFNSVDHYQSDTIFQSEQTQLFERLPTVCAHTSEIPHSGDFLTSTIAGKFVLLTRDAQGVARAFLNICRHRGTPLVSGESGCKQRFTCPYHAWTYANTGELLSAPHLDSGFPDIDKNQYSLRSLPCVERFGFIWVEATPDTSFDFDDYYAPIAAEAEALGLANMGIAAADRHRYRCNWKILVEGGLEAYHFKIAHRKTIGPYFEDNLSSYQLLGDHIRSVLMRSSMRELAGMPQAQWRLRDHANIIYTFFPTTQLLVQSDHVVWINICPISATETELRLTTLAPMERLDEHEYWSKNHNITVATLTEDFVIGESIQAGLASSANENMTFGRFEGALPRFNSLVKHYTSA